MSQQHSQQLVASAISQIAGKGFPADMSDMEGPTSTSNWVVKDLILCGDYPKGPKLGKLISAGVVHFIDLRANGDNYVSAEGVGLGEIADELQYTQFDMYQHVSSVHHNDLTETALMLRGVLADCILNGKVAYLHCGDGHTLTTIAVCGLLSFIYGVSGLKASAMAAQLHGSRKDNENIHQLLPTPSAKAFVRELGTDTSPYPTNLFQGGASGSFERSTSSRGNSPTQHQAPHAPHFSQAAPAMMQPNAFDGVSAGPSSQNNSPQRSAAATPGGGVSPNNASSSGRFEHTKGHGGGFTSINLFGSDQDAMPTPTRRTGRASVSGMSPDYRPNSAAKPTPSPNNTHRDPMAAYHPSHTQSGSSIDLFNQSGGSIAGNSPMARGGSSPSTSVPATPEAGAGSQQRPATRSGTTRNATTALLPNANASSEGQTNYHPPASYPANEGVHPQYTDHRPDYVLPPILNPRKEKDLIRGPNAVTNWVVRNQVLAGPLPHPNQKEFGYLVQQRFDTMVCLQEFDETTGYIDDYRRMARHDTTTLHYTMFDGAVIPHADFDRFLSFVGELCDRVMNGEKLYIHCKGGHGRTGMVVSVMLALLYNLSGMKAVNLTDALHECRLNTEGVASPEQEQRTCVVSMLTALERSH